LGIWGKKRIAGSATLTPPCGIHLRCRSPQRDEEPKYIFRLEKQGDPPQIEFVAPRYSWTVVPLIKLKLLLRHRFRSALRYRDTYLWIVLGLILFPKSGPPCTPSGALPSIHKLRDQETAGITRGAAVGRHTMVFQAGTDLPCRMV
jgi:hypothetical protein